MLRNMQICTRRTLIKHVLKKHTLRNSYVKVDMDVNCDVFIKRGEVNNSDSPRSWSCEEVMTLNFKNLADFLFSGTFEVSKQGR